MDQLSRSVERGAWHGPAVAEVLEGVSAARAGSRPLPGCHNAWEIVVHMTAWTRAVRRAVDGAPVTVTKEENWPPLEDTSASAWERAQSEFFQETEALLSRLKSHDDGLLEKTVAGREYNFYHLLHGIVQHNLYHAGQIRLLTK